MNSENTTQFQGFGFFELIVLAVFISIIIWPYWRIFRKAGFPGALAILMLLPLINFIMILVLAFARWPAFQRAEALERENSELRARLSAK